MKVIFVAVNAKYIHTSPAVRILKCIAEKQYSADFAEFTIKDSAESMAEKLKDYDAVGLSCYIWNISVMKHLAAVLKKEYPEKTVFAGGPEVSFEPQAFTEDFDYILCGEGEEIILPFLAGLQNGEAKAMPWVAHKEKPFALPRITENLENVPEIFSLYTPEDFAHRVIYTELSRGCPFQCAYCLSSLEKGVRLFDETRRENTFRFIESNHFHCIKFLDRTFNMNPEKFIAVCRRLEQTENVYQFEIEAGLFTEEVIDFLCCEVTPGKFRLEIGIQSLNEQSVRGVNRVQDNQKLLNTVQRIRNAGRCTLHVDLIAGLPYETLATFREGYNRVFALQCEELQLGFLKMLRGTKIRNEAELFDCKYSPTEPYEITENRFLSPQDLEIIHRCEESAEWMWNGKNGTTLLKHLLKDNAVTDWFGFFAGFRPYYNKTMPLHKNFESLLQYLSDIHLLCRAYIDDLKFDYLSKVKIRPQPFWKNFAYEDFKTVKNVLSQTMFLPRNAFVTTFYGGYLLVDYTEKKPLLKQIFPENS